jgi:hypothetical protein
MGVSGQHHAPAALCPGEAGWASEPVWTSDVRWKIFHRKFSAIIFQKIFRFLKSSLNISFFHLFLVALGLNEIAVTVDIAEYRNKEKLAAM